MLLERFSNICPLKYRLIIFYVQVQLCFFYSRGYDCINGTILQDQVIPKPTINFTVFWEIVRNSELLLDPQLRFLPPQNALTIYNNSRLYINLEGCVNTLQGECKEFLQTHGRDGKNQTSHSRFACFYNKVSVLHIFRLTTLTTLMI